MLSESVKAYYSRWLDKRLPLNSTIELSQKRLFVLPSKQSIYFFLVMLLLIIAGINYQNNLAYALCFFLFSLFLTAIFLTFFNLKGLVLQAGKSTPAFVGEYADFTLHLKKRSRRQHHRLQIGFTDNLMVHCDLVLEDELTVNLRVKTLKRGLLKPGRYTIKTHYPLGVVTCWSNLAMPMQTLVYPAPKFLSKWPSTAVIGGDGQMQSPLSGQDEFYGFRPYLAGDSPRSLNWRGLAKGQNITTKMYQSVQDNELWVDWYALTANSTERRLSLLCGWVITLHQNGQAYGLRLPDVEIAPNAGGRHYHRVLSKLALFNNMNG